MIINDKFIIEINKIDIKYNIFKLTNTSDIFLNKISKREAVDRKLTKHDKYYAMIVSPLLEEINFGMILYYKNKHHKLIITIISVLDILLYQSKCSILTATFNISIFYLY